MEDHNTSNFSTVVSLLRQAESLLSRQAQSPGNQVQSAEDTNQSRPLSGARQSQIEQSDHWQTSGPYFRGTVLRVLAIGLLSLPLRWGRQGRRPVRQASVRKVMFWL